MRAVGIWGTGSYLPEKVLTNKDLEKCVDTSHEWIVSRTGIHERRVAAPDQASSDLAVPAAQRAMAEAGVEPDEIELVIVSTVTPDMICPATSCLVQHQLGISRAATFDLSAACAGFLYGMATASQFIITGMYRNALVIGVDCLSRITDYTDRSTCVLFGDGAGAAVLGPVEDQYGFLAHTLHGDGSGGHFLQVPAGGSRQPPSLTTVERGLHFLKMDGREVFRFAVRSIGPMIEEALEKASLRQDQVDFLVPHQANIRIIESALHRFGWTEDQVVVNLDRYGNISSASIPVALDELVRSGRLHRGHHVILCGFGAGLTWGASAMRWVDVKRGRVD
ncbi:beta-ketoacyl-ACP synthase III [Pasteuria penetrans]|uniref:beta-ketoacyl-ACP synthase III n=1 Tax=Pasteuria penetrans TaxID=86005 RepID=UPI000FB3A0BB|nr:beta-ketoacyl-ACP synthase III [Pasteuria penetrans]